MARVCEVKAELSAALVTKLSSSQSTNRTLRPEESNASTSVPQLYADIKTSSFGFSPHASRNKATAVRPDCVRSTFLFPNHDSGSKRLRPIEAERVSHGERPGRGHARAAAHLKLEFL